MENVYLKIKLLRGALVIVKQMAMDKRKAVLKFPDLKTSIDSTVLVDVSNCEIVRTRAILPRELTDAKIILARTDLGNPLLHHFLNKKPS